MNMPSNSDFADGDTGQRAYSGAPTPGRRGVHGQATIRRHQPRRRGERGASLLEFAFVIPILLMVALAIFTGGNAFNQKLSVTNSVREGARYGATVPKLQAFAAGTTWATSVRNVVVQRSNGTLQASQVCVALVTGSPPVVITPPSGHIQNEYAESGTAASTAACFDDGSGDPGTRVEVSASTTASLDFAAWHQTVTLSAKGIAKYESS